ncbi:MAG TPA: Gfo/Idh/MocA family oxidoreductase [Verrucomicrobiales bacterium]|nr:Gfo/Idh/MocA family oxidoreductase [Verrucomicrobiales bacterium]
MSRSFAPGPGRRRFLQTAAAAGLPTVLPARLFGQQAPSKRITLGLIGAGDHGTHRNLNMLLQQEDAHILAVCDVFRSRREQARDIVNRWNENQDCGCYGDFRELLARDDIDAVMISTPDHWHVLMSLLAIRAGKDVICEKPTLTIEEGRILAGAVQKHKAVFQTSTEDRSMPVYHRMAELVRNGRIGKLQTIRVRLPAGDRWPSEEPAPVPEHLDYDLWLGPAPEAPYTPLRTEPMRWRQIRDYSGGLLTDWGAHQIDTAQWANDTERTGPVHVEGKGTLNEGSAYNTFIDYQLHYRYANGVDLLVESGGTSLRFEGADGWIGNSGWAEPLHASSPGILEAPLGPGDTRLFTCPDGEHRNFLDCVKTRSQPYLPAEEGHRLSTILHLGNIAMLTGRSLRWDPETESFPDDPAASAMKSRPMRAPWTLAES